MVQHDISLGRVVDTMAEGVMVVARDCGIVLWNHALAELTGWTSDDMKGKTCSELICPAADGTPAEEPVSDCELLKHVGEQPVVSHVKCFLKTRAGKTVPVLKNGRVLFEDGEPVAAIVTFTDLRPLHQLEEALEAARRDLDRTRPPGRLVGASREMGEVYERIRLAADSDATVLILGETGTGKERVAEAIHAGSARCDAPFVKVNCSALPENLLESELFGHVRGAFTGATHDKVGRFEAAAGGTVFLDEIGDVSPLIQLKLLRVLQEREFERVGESTPRKADVRVICATHRDLRERIREGEFREDLYYRIRVFPIPLPPLRHRKTDIPLLVEAFIGRFNEQTGKHITGISDDVLHCLMDHCWPGNVRELENAIEHAFVVCRQGEIGLFDLPTEIRMMELRSATCRESRFGEKPASSSPCGSSSGADCRERLLTTLQQCNWNRSEAARRLGVDRTTVWRKMKQWDIQPPKD